MTISLTKRLVKGSMLTAVEHDANLTAIENEVNADLGFSNVAVSGQTTIAAATETATLNVAAGTNVTLTTNNSTKTLTITAAGGSGLTDGDKGDITVGGSGTTLTIDNDAVTLAKIANAVASSKLLGSGASGAGADYAELTLGTNLSMSGTTLNAASGAGSLPANIIDASASPYNVVADGTTDNATALMAMRTTMAATDRNWIVYFPPGQINYSNNKWICNVRRVTLMCRGVTFQNTAAASGSDRSYFNLRNGALFDDAPLTSDIPSTAVTTYLFNDANLGATTITTTTAAHAGNFSAGQRILLYHFDQQFGGKPPNARFFEWHTVVSAVVGTGVITLEAPLAYNYRNAVGDSAVSGDVPACGRPRIVGLDRSDYVYPEYVEIIGATWKLNANSTASHMFMCMQGRVVRLISVKSPAILWISENESFYAENCEFGNAFEPDKIVGRAELKNCRIYGFCSGATGIRELIIDGGYYYGPQQLSPQKLIVRNATFTLAAPTAAFGLFRPLDTFSSDFWDISNIRMISDTRLDYVVNQGALITLTIDAISGRSILLDDSNATDKGHMGAIRIGMVLWRSDGLKAGKVTAMGHDGAGHFKIDGTWQAPVAAESWRYYPIVRTQASNIIQDAPAIAKMHRQYVPNTVGDGRAQWLKITSEEYTQNSMSIPVYCYVRQILGKITRAYTGGTSGILVHVIRIPFTIKMAMDSTVVGSMRAGIEGTGYASASAGTAPSALTQGDFWEEVSVQVITGGGGNPAGTVDQLPQWEIDVELVPLIS